MSIQTFPCFPQVNLLQCFLANVIPIFTKNGNSTKSITRLPIGSEVVSEIHNDSYHKPLTFLLSISYCLKNNYIKNGFVSIH